MPPKTRLRGHNRIYFITFLLSFSLFSDRAVTRYRVFRGGKCVKPHRPAGVQFLGGNSYFRTQAEHEPVGKSRGRVMVNARAIDSVQKFLGVSRVIGNNRFRVVGGVFVDMRYRAF